MIGLQCECNLSESIQIWKGVAAATPVALDYVEPDTFIFMRDRTSTSRVRCKYGAYTT